MAEPFVGKKAYSIERLSRFGPRAYIITVTLYGKKTEIEVLGKKIENVYHDDRSVFFLWNSLPTGVFHFECIEISDLEILQDRAILKRLTQGEEYENPYEFERLLKRLKFVREDR